MNTEFQNLDIELKRTQLAREQLALADELKKRERRENAMDAARGAVRTAGEVTGRAASVATPVALRILMYFLKLAALGLLAVVVLLGYALYAWRFYPSAYQFQYVLGLVFGYFGPIAAVAVVVCSFLKSADGMGKAISLAVLAAVLLNVTRTVPLWL